jgi:hypothetical protein
MSSSRRFKEDIQDMNDASSGLLRLRPVTYRYQKAYEDGSKPLDYGLIAEEVAEVYPDLVVRGKDGQIETVQYHKLVPMLLNELQKEHETPQTLLDKVALLQAQVSEFQRRWRFWHRSENLMFRPRRRKPSVDCWLRPLYTARQNYSNWTSTSHVSASRDFLAAN